MERETKTVCVLTATRAEYGLLKRLILRMQQVPWFRVRVAVTGAHLSEAFGSTCREIEEDGIEIDCKIPILTGKDDPAGILEAMGRALTGFGAYFARTTPDALVVLGDRYETMAVCIAAMMQGILIAHLHGGELTQGAVDDAIRHSITKMSYLHFTSTEQYRRRVIQLGEQPERVFNVGAMSVENILCQEPVSRQELERFLHFDLSGEYAVVTFHPVTLEPQAMRGQMEALTDALRRYPRMKYLITKANADAGGRAINAIWEACVRDMPQRFRLVDSLGMKRYLSALRESAMVIGNSSSGITEAPVLGVPTVNIGDRQKGRLRAASVIDCPPVESAITAAMDRACSSDFRRQIQNQKNPYGSGNTSEQITRILEKTLSGRTDLKKRFYDWEPDADMRSGVSQEQERGKERAEQ